MVLKQIDKEVVDLLAGDAYLSYLRLLVKVIGAKQIVELGAYKGLSTAMMMDFLDGHIYSVDVNPSAWELVDAKRLLTKVVGDDNDINIWKDVDVDLKKTDLWFIDSWHDDEHVFKTLEVYKPYFKKGTVIVFDDICTIPKVWETLPYDKLDITFYHYPGLGICKI